MLCWTAWWTTRRNCSLSQTVPLALCEYHYCSLMVTMAQQELCRVLPPLSTWDLYETGFYGSHGVFWELFVVNVAPPALISLLEGVTRLWMTTTLHSWHFLLPLAVFAVSQTSLGFQWCRRKCVTAWNKAQHQYFIQRDNLGRFTNQCFLLCYWNKSEFRAYCCKDAVLDEKRSSEAVNFSVSLPLGTKEWSTWLARTGGTYSTWSLCRRTSPTSSLTGGSMWPRVPAGNCSSGLTESSALLSIV